MKNLVLIVILSVTVHTSQALSRERGNINWSSVPSQEIPLFYPGQSSLEWLIKAEHGPGAKAVLAGKNCQDCHGDETAEMGEILVSGERLEPEPIPGKAGSLTVTVQAAYDNDFIYLKASWPARQNGSFHEYIVYRNGKWETYASHRTHKDVKAGNAKASYEDRFSLILGEGRNIPAFNVLGCWITCHDSMRNMPDAPSEADVEAHPGLGKRGMKKRDIRKYLQETRVTPGGIPGDWAKMKAESDLDALFAKGIYLDLWQWRAYRSNPVGIIDDSYVFQYRNFDTGEKSFESNWDNSRKLPRFMYKPSGNRGAALSESQFRDPKAPRLDNSNHVVYRPDHPWENGDLLPKYVLNNNPSGSSADITGSGTHADGRWTVYIKRKLDTGHKDDIALSAGRSYPIGMAVHDDNVTTRFHYVSLPLILSLGEKGGHIKAVFLK